MSSILKGEQNKQKWKKMEKKKNPQRNEFIEVLTYTRITNYGVDILKRYSLI